MLLELRSHIRVFVSRLFELNVMIVAAIVKIIQRAIRIMSEVFNGSFGDTFCLVRFCLSF
jgi:hypothetical protein